LNLRILSGMRPTAKLHLGNYFSVLKNWVKLQEDNECYFCVVDWHALTSDYADTSLIRYYTREITIDYLSCGLDPEKSVIFLQSQVKEHAELFLLLGMLATVGRLERVPTYKEVRAEIKDKDLSTFGFLGYPILMAADILMYKADAVPVGKDQEYHIEFTREIARKFNALYGNVLAVPRALFAPIAKVPGIDGRKMSKSYGNAIFLSDTFDEVRKKIMPMVTDTNRKRRTDPGDPDKCPIWLYHLLFNDDEESRNMIANGCRKAKIGCVDCKKILLQKIKEKMEPIWEKRAKLEQDQNYILDVLKTGSQKARETARKTMESVNEAVRIGLR